MSKLYVGPIQGDTGTHTLREDLVKRLRSKGGFQIVATAQEADAILTGTAQLWVRGHISVNPRTPPSNAQPAYSGYLSVEVSGRDSEPLWSYLVTPRGSLLGSITDNLAENTVNELIKARKQAGQSHTMTASAESGARTTLHGAGASFPAPLYRLWIDSYEQRHPEISINYETVGSEAGTKLLAEGKVDFAASEVPPKNGDTSTSGEFPRLASVLGGVVPIYNLKSVGRDLKFTASALAGIYLGTITRWNDPAIRDSNRGIKLPDERIVVIHRADGSGTTHAWSSFLSRTNERWRKTVGTGATLTWPVGEGATFNEGVASAVAATADSIGYVELVYAIHHQLTYGAVENGAGVFVRADLNSLTEATQEGAPGAGSASKKAYPIVSFTWLLLPQKTEDAQKRTTMIDFLQWILTSGQKQCAALGYVPLPRDVQVRQLDLLHRLQ